MNLGRRLLLPAVIAAPLTLWLMAIPFRGFGVLAEFSWLVRPMDWVFVILLNLIGISAIVLPASAFLRPRQIPVIAKGAILLAVGAIGGGLMAIFFIFLLGALSGGVVEVASSPETLAVAQYGFLPGALGTIVWIALNRRDLGKSEMRNA